MRNVTLCFLFKDNQILLAMKKRGFGANRWNGFGGKPEGKDRTIEDTAIRELGEESGGLRVKLEAIKKVSEIEFFFTQKPEWDQCVHTFFVHEWEGEPQETEEMRPQWFDLGTIPYGEMWPEDKLWLPRVILGEKIKGKIYFKDLEGHAEKMEFGEGDF